MKNYTITVNGNVYDVTVEEGTGSTAGAAKAATPKAAAPKAAPKAAAPAGAQGAVRSMHQCLVRFLRLTLMRAQQLRRVMYYSFLKL